jgi:4-amino-4-deoxy-L-arabinose transferase-like glycosyltransferase
MLKLFRGLKGQKQEPIGEKKLTPLEYIKDAMDVLGGNQYILMVSLIFLVALVLRLWNIGQIPGGFSENERDILQSLIDMNHNRLWLGGEFYRGAYLYPAIILMKIFGFRIIVLRIFSGVIGALTVLTSYFFIAKWFSKKIAIFAAFLFAISSFHITVSRLILPDILLPLVLLLLFVLLTEAYRKKNVYLFGISGAVLGLGLYTSPAFLIIPILFLSAGTYFVVKNKKFITAYKKELLVSLMGFIALSIPFLVSFIGNPYSYLTHFGFNRSIWQIIMNIGQIPAMLFARSNVNYFLSLGSEPLLDPFIFITAVGGFIYALAGIKRRKYFFLVVWLLLFFLYAALKRGVQPIDLLGALPILYAFSALVLDYILVVWFKTFPYNKNARILAIGLISIFFALSALYNYQRYFVAYKYSKEVKTEFSAHPPEPIK